MDSRDGAICLTACLQCLGTEVICSTCGFGGTDGCRCPNGPDAAEPCPCVADMMDAVVVMDEQAEFTQEQYELLRDDDEEPDECDGCHEEGHDLRQFEGWSGLKQWLCDDCYHTATIEE